MKKFPFLFFLIFFKTLPSFALEKVDVSTATGQRIEFDEVLGVAIIEGNAKVESSTATIHADRIEVYSKKKQASAFGNVLIEQTSATITGTEAFYDWEVSSGIILNATAISLPWQVSSDKLIQKNPAVYEMASGDITSCDAKPPHYHIRSARALVLWGDRVKLKNARFVSDELPLFWLPIYNRSLKPKKYNLRLEPGHTSRDGFTNRTILGYPITPHSYTKFRWDFLERTGNGGGVEHRYFHPKLKGEFDSYYVRDTNPDPEPQRRRYSLLWNHYQSLTSVLSVNSKIDLKSDQSFGNQFQGIGNQIRVENQTRGVFSELGLNYQFSKASLQAQFDRRDQFDSLVSSSNFIGKITLPRITFDTIPLSFRHFPVYTRFFGRFTNETLSRTTPITTLRYQRSAAFGSQLSKDLKISKKTTVTPLVSYEETWQDRDLISTTSLKDVYVGRASLGTNLRQRLNSLIDLNLGYRYLERFRQNQLKADVKAADRGVETHQFSTSVDTWLGRKGSLRLSSGYDLRDAPRNDTSKYKHLSERFFAPSMDLIWQLKKNIELRFRETYGLFDSASRSSIRTPINTSGEIQFGPSSGLTHFAHGFSYSKPTSGALSELVMTDKLKFYLTPRWYIDLFVSYRAVGKEKLAYKKVFPIERTIRVVRDLHCWVLRMDFSQRPGFSEASFFIDLKVNVNSNESLFLANSNNVNYSARDPLPDVSALFPASGEENKK